MARVSWGCHLGHSGLNDWTDLSIYWTTQHICFIVIFACSCSIESRLDLDSTVHDIIWLYILSILLLPIISQSNWSCHDTALARTGVINATQVWNQGLYNSPSLTLSFPLQVSIVHLLCIFSIESKTLPLLLYFFICFHFLKNHLSESFRDFCSVKSAPRQLAAFVLSPLPPAALPAPLKAPAAPAMHSSPQDPSSIKSINRFNRYWQSIGDLPVFFSSTGLHVNTCTFMTFPNADPVMVQTSWRPGQLAGWFIQRKDTTTCW